MFLMHPLSTSGVAEGVSSQPGVQELLVTGTLQPDSSWAAVAFCAPALKLMSQSKLGIIHTVLHIG